MNRVTDRNTGSSLHAVFFVMLALTGHLVRLVRMRQNPALSTDMPPQSPGPQRHGNRLHIRCQSTS